MVMSSSYLKYGTTLTFQIKTPYFIGVLVLNRGKSAEVGKE
ncbi:unnamed protein product [marine sediment metagenome]|uniref:Uncharacterized protein n=1 Tax=marine sediment metagenome TaxID=412755 RepID=X1S130_9ZZZZ